MRKGFIANRLRSGRKSVEDPIESKVETIQGEKFVWINLQNPDRKDVESIYYSFAKLVFVLGLTPKDLWSVFSRKNQCNMFRIETNY